MIDKEREVKGDCSVCFPAKWPVTVFNSTLELELMLVDLVVITES